MEAVKTFCTAFVIATMGSAFLVTPVLAQKILHDAGPAGEKMDCSGSERSKQQVSSDAIKPGDRPDHVLVQFVRIDVYSSNNPEFDGSEVTWYGHIDGIAAYGAHSGYQAQTLKSGETLWAQFDGVGYTVGTRDAWEIRYQGLFHFVGGTGKYKAIRGGGYYSGVLTPAGVNEEIPVCSAEY